MRARMMLCVAFATLLPGVVHGQTWDGGGADNNWSTAAN